MCEQKWAIWSVEHQAWWRPDGVGYSKKMEHAGRYTAEEAWEICRPDSEASTLGDYGDIAVPVNFTYSKGNASKTESSSTSVVPSNSNSIQKCGASTTAGMI